ncbi:MAG: NIL domain-containing protein [Halanaerobiaceae bacterium]
MYSKRVQLVYHPNTVDKPIIYDLIKHFDIVINIIQAKILPDEEGKLVMDMKASEGEYIEKGIKYLVEEGVDVQLVEESVVYNKDNCVFCGACTGLCKAGALSMDRETWELKVEHDKCLLCGMCITACGFDALTLEVNGI